MIACVFVVHRYDDFSFLWITLNCCCLSLCPTSCFCILLLTQSCLFILKFKSFLAYTGSFFFYFIYFEYNIGISLCVCGNTNRTWISLHSYYPHTHQYKTWLFRLFRFYSNVVLSLGISEYLQLEKYYSAQVVVCFYFVSLLCYVQETILNIEAHTNTHK